MSDSNARKMAPSSSSSSNSEKVTPPSFRKPHAIPHAATITASSEGGDNGSSTTSSDSNNRRQQQQQNPLPAAEAQHQQQQQQQQLQHYGGGHYMKWGGDRGSEEDSVHYLSEPSISEEGDSTTADNRDYLEHSLLSGDDDDDDDDDDDEDELEEDMDTDDREDGGSPPPPPPSGPPPPPRNSSISSGMASPGNTSLSSWESHFRPRQFNRVRIHFSPEPPAAGRYTDRHYFNNYQYQYQNQQQPQRLFPPQNEVQSRTLTSQILPQQAQQSQQQSQQHLQQQLQQNNSNNNNNINNNRSNPSSPSIRGLDSPSTDDNRQPATSPNSNTNNNASRASHNTNSFSYSTFSISTMSSADDTPHKKEHQPLNEFLQDLRQQSQGSVLDSTVMENVHDSSFLLNTSTDDSLASPSPQKQTNNPKTAGTLDSVLRHNDNNGMELFETPAPSSRHRRISSVETELIGNTSDAHLDDDGGEDHDQERKRPANERSPSMDESPLVLNLSLLGEDDEDGGDHEEEKDNKDETTKTAKESEAKSSPEQNQETSETKSNGTAQPEKNPKHNTNATASRPSTDSQVSSSNSNDTPKSHHKPKALSFSFGGTGTSTVRNNIWGDSTHTYVASTTDDDDPRHFDSHHSADDEQTQLRPPRLKRGNGKPSVMHRRTRSGDSAAAALSTGGFDWKGMSKDKIPMPVGDDDDDEDDDGKERKEDSPPQRSAKEKERKGDMNGSNQGNKKKSQFTPGSNNNNNNATSNLNNSNSEKALFSVGKADASAASRAAARKQRRVTRQQQRTVAEKAAAAAREKRIQKQYQEWSRSPLWKLSGQRQQHHLGHMDSSEASTGSIPSMIEQKLSNSGRGGVNGPGGIRPAYNFSTGGADGIRSDDEIPLKRRNSLDTLSSGLSMPSALELADGRNRRNSVGSRDSFFSWISTSHREGGEVAVSQSPFSRSQTIQVHPNWSPRVSSLASPRWQPQMDHSDRGQRDQRSQTMAGRHSLSERPNFTQYPLVQQQQDSFRRYLLQQQKIGGEESFRRYDDAVSPPQNALGSYVLEGFPTPPISNPSHGSFDFSGHSQGDESVNSSSGDTTTSSGSEEDDEFRDVMLNRVYQASTSVSFDSLDRAEQSAEAQYLQRGSVHHVIRHHHGSPFANFGKKQAGTTPKKFDRASFLPTILPGDKADFPTYRCPRCQTIQREFFTVDNAPKQFQTASGFLALSFVLYVIASLYIFGLEEGWPALDCIYFAVITLTTAGLGDFVPTSDFNKIICSIFIYFGVACIGLLLGSYIAGMLDETSRRQAQENRLNSCPNCTRLQNIKDAAEKRHLSALNSSLLSPATPFNIHLSEHVGYHQGHRPSTFIPQRDSISPVQADLDDNDKNYAHKKIKRQHDSNSTPLMPCPTTSTAPSAQRPTATKFTNSVAGANGVSPASASVDRKGNADSNPLDDDRTPGVSDFSELTGQNTAEGKLKKPNLKINTKNEPPPPPPPPSGFTTSIGVRGWASPNSKSPRSPAVTRPGQPTPRQIPPTPRQTDLLGSPLTKQILGRQNHTRHASFDVNGGFSFQNVAAPTTARNFDHETHRMRFTPTISEDAPFVPGTGNMAPKEDIRSGLHFEHQDSSFSENALSMDDSSVLSTDSFGSEESDEFELTKTRVRTAKYVFLTLKEALVNSMVIIAVGCLGFWVIEGFTLVDSWYFTTVLLTTVGYGDIVPITKGGKLFATIYILVAGTILLNNMSLISMIPLELRKRRIERAVLTQFGDLLDDEALRELASGPLIQRLRLSANRTDGLNECTREMFALAMLVRLGKVKEEDILSTFHAFNRLDVNGDGVLNSRSIIAGMINKSRAKANLASFGSQNTMRRSGSKNNLRTPRGPAPMYGGINQHCFSNDKMGSSSSAGTPQASYGMGLGLSSSNSIRIPNDSFGTSTETSALLQHDQGYNTLSRSG